jgi:hypothetical protein
MYANGCYWEADRRSYDLWVVGIGKTGVFPESGIRILSLDPMEGDEFGSFPGGRCLRREGSHPHEGLQLTGAV